LKFTAVDLERRARIAHQRFRRRFHQPCLARSCWPKEEKASNRPPGTRHARKKRLVDIDDLLNRFVLANDPAVQLGFEPLSLPPRLFRIQLSIQSSAGPRASFVYQPYRAHAPLRARGGPIAIDPSTCGDSP